MKKNLLLLLLVNLIAVHSMATGSKKQVKLRVTEISTAVFDETSVSLDLGARQYLFPEDGQKVFDTTSSAPSLYSFSADMVPCFSNSYGNFTSYTIVPLGLRVKGNGLYSIRASMIDNFDATTIVRLEDRQLGNFHDLRSGDYTFNLNQVTQTDTRFFLHISYPAAVTTTDAGCANNDGAIVISQDSSINWSNLTLYDDSNNVVAVDQNVKGNFSYNNLPYGQYTLQFTYGTYITTTPVNITGWSVTNQASASTEYAATGQYIHFYSTATHATTYSWDFGDGSTIDGIANPDYAYTLPGTYNVKLTSSNNYGCSGESNLTVYISEATGINNVATRDTRITLQNRAVQVSLGNTPAQNATVEIINAAGQLLQTSPLTQQLNTIDISNQPAGIYVVRVANNGNSLTKKVVLN